MSETIYGKFGSAGQALAAQQELMRSGAGDNGVRYEPQGFVVTVDADPSWAVIARAILERNGGRTEVDDIPDAGTIPDDPLGYSEDVGDELG